MYYSQYIKKTFKLPATFVTLPDISIGPAEISSLENVTMRTQTQVGGTNTDAANNRPLISPDYDNLV